MRGFKLPKGKATIFYENGSSYTLNNVIWVDYNSSTFIIETDRKITQGISQNTITTIDSDDVLYVQYKNGREVRIIGSKYVSFDVQPNQEHLPKAQRASGTFSGDLTITTPKEGNND